MEGIGEQGLFIIAALVIAFINWLSGTLKKKQAARRGEDGQVQAHQHQADEEAQEYLDADSWPSPDDEAELAPMTGTEPDDPNREIREFFAALSGSPPVEAPPVPVMEIEEEEIPPPLPPAEPVHEPPSHDGYQVAAYGVGPGHRSGQHPIIKKLRKEGGAREAFIFSEILGKPKSLRKTGS